MAVNRERSTRSDSVSVDIDGTLGDALVKIQELIVQYGAATRIECADDTYEDNWRRVYVFPERYETDAEMAVRIANEERAELYQAERDRREFERLRAQFEGK